MSKEPAEPRGPHHWDEALLRQQEIAQDGYSPARTDYDWKELRRSKLEADLIAMQVAGEEVMLPEDVRYIILHCSKTAPGTDIGAVDLGRMHRARNMLSIGYHYVIRRSGECEVGRASFKPGCHAKGYNDCSIGVCLIGGRDLLEKPADNFTAPQRDTLKGLLAELKEQYPNARVVGHSDLDHSQDCPCLTW